jgi:hypothetical protein
VAVVTLRLQICHDIGRSWSVRGLSAQPTTDFASLRAVIDYARRECAGAPATIELMVDGFYAVVHQENGWPRELVAPEAKPLSTGPGDGGEDRSHFSRLCDWVTGRRLG